MRWADHVIRAEEMRNIYKILVRNLRGRDHLEYVGMEWRIILKRILKNRI
jgi:hypothetical protein